MGNTFLLVWGQRAKYCYVSLWNCLGHTRTTQWYRGLTSRKILKLVQSAEAGEGSNWGSGGSCGRGELKHLMTAIHMRRRSSARTPVIASYRIHWQTIDSRRRAGHGVRCWRRLMIGSRVTWSLVPFKGNLKIASPQYLKIARLAPGNM